MSADDIGKALRHLRAAQRELGLADDLVKDLRTKQCLANARVASVYAEQRLLAAASEATANGGTAVFPDQPRLFKVDL